MGHFQRSELFPGGWTSRVSTASASDPPMTTMASGLCACAPMPFESAAGRSPSIATRVVMSPARKRWVAAAWAPWSSDLPSAHWRWAYVTTGSRSG